MSPEEQDDSKSNGTIPEEDTETETDAASVWWPQKTRQCSFRRFSVDLSTEELFRINQEEEDPIFVGAFGHIRKHNLDHDNFHAYYRKERQWLHDSIIEDYLVNDAALGIDDESYAATSEATTAYTPQWLIFTVGVQGGGKHYSMQTLREENALLLQHQTYCCVDTDELRRLLPEYDFYLHHAQELVDVLTQKEAGYIAETLCWAALQSGQSVFWDTSLRYPEWMVRALVPNLRQAFPDLRVAVVHVVAPSAEIVHQRRVQKEQETRRHLFPDDLESIESEMFRIEQAVDVIRSAADFVVELCNRDEGLEMTHGNWDGFLAAFLQDSSSKEAVLDTSPQRLPRLVSQECFVPIDDENTHQHLRSMSYTQSSFNNIAMRSSFLSRRATSNVSQSTSGTACSQGRRGTSRRRFSIFQSTEENHGTTHMNFYGRFSKIRSTLDYSYHRNYTFERQRFQDSIIGYFLEGAVITDKDGILCTTPTEPWIVFTAGPMGAGKSYTMRQLVNRGRFPLVAFVNVDPDEIRRRFPEYQLYVNQNPELAGELTRKEAGFMAEILTLAALQAGKNVLQDGSLRDAEWYKGYFAKLRHDFPLLKLAIIQVTAPKETVLERAVSRGKQTGRVVPESVLLQAYEQVPKSVKILGPLVDYHATIYNPAQVSDVELVTPGETWQSFQSQWIQTCAWVPKKKVQENLRRNYSRLSLPDTMSHDDLEEHIRKNYSAISLPDRVAWLDEKDTLRTVDDPVEVAEQ